MREHRMVVREIGHADYAHASAGLDTRELDSSTGAAVRRMYVASAARVVILCNGPENRSA